VLKIGSEREPDRLLEIACDAARVIISAEYAAIGILEEDGRTLKHFVTSGLDPGTIARIGPPPTGKGVLGKLLSDGKPLRLRDITADPDSVGFPAGHPPMRSFLGVPLVSPTGLYGRLYLTEKIGASEFSEDDQRVAVALGAQTAVAYENAYRYDEIQRHAAQLQVEIGERRRAEETLREKERLLSEAQRIGHIGSWNYDIINDSLQYSDEMYQLLDVSPQEFQHNRARFLGLVFAADREEAAKWMELITVGRQVKNLEFRVFRQDGELRYLQSGGAVVFDTNGNPARFIGTIQDITERKLAEIQIHQQLDHLNALRRIDLAIMSSFDLRSTLETILSEVVSELQVDAAAVLLLNPEDQTLEVAARQGFRTRAPENERMPIIDSHAIRVAKERRLIKIENLNDQSDDPLLTIVLAGEDFVCYYGVPLITKGEVKGVLEIFHRVPLQPYPDWLDFLNTLAGQTAIAIEDATLFKNLQESILELFQAYDATIEGWSRALDLRDRETEGHTLRVTEMMISLARRFGFDEEELKHIHWGALLHDIGKMGVPDHILLKPGPLTGEEQLLMQKHPQYAYDLIQPIAFLRPALDIPYCHHEKWDGTGYPRGLKGKEIPLTARLFAIVDSWDALTSDRPYRPAWSKEEALAYMREESGKQFDPQVVDLFLKIIK
jgi:putative nucleotidyltransferase with HDIG domain